jgi:hypothetical protein
MARAICVMALGLAACRARSTTPAPPPPAAPAPGASPEPISVPTLDPTSLCADVGTMRVCWDDVGNLDRAAHVIARALPSVPAASPLGWRCAWPGPTHLCFDRRAAASAFSCAGDRCTQPHARRPDDGEWTCVDTAGAEVCLGGERAAGVVTGQPDPAWICGARRWRPGVSTRAERVCVDFAPDFPDGDGAHWTCRAVNGPAPSRECQRGATAGSLGVACDRARPCVDGAVCASGRCVSRRPAPSCWLDDDCAGGVCRFGTCRDEATP